MSTFTVTIKTSGAAFAGADLHRELGRILEHTASEVTGGVTGGVLFDVNGVRVGEFSWDNDLDNRIVGELEEGQRFRFEGKREVYVVERLMLGEPGEQDTVIDTDRGRVICDYADSVEVIS